MSQSRKHFRIDLEALVQCTIIDEPQANNLATMIRSRVPSESIDSEAVKINKQILDAIAALSNSNMQLGHLLDMLNMKINLLTQEVEFLKALNPQSGVPANILMPINISGGGALIYYQQELDAGTLLDCKITFVPEHVAVRSVARAIKSFPAEGDPNGEWRVAIEFTHMHEEDQDRVVRKVLQEQTKQLRAQKRAEREAAESNHA